MDWNQVEGNWRQVRGNVKKQWGKLTDDDLTAIDGRREALEGRIQERYGYTKDRVRKEIEEWQRSFAAQLSRSSDELADQIDAIRDDIQSLTSTISRIANSRSTRPRQGDGRCNSGGGGNQAAILFLQWRWRSDLASCSASSRVDRDRQWRANRACRIPARVVQRIRTCRKTPLGADRDKERSRSQKRERSPSCLVGWLGDSQVITSSLQLPLLFRVGRHWESGVDYFGLCLPTPRQNFFGGGCFTLVELTFGKRKL